MLKSNLANLDKCRFGREGANYRIYKRMELMINTAKREKRTIEWDLFQLYCEEYFMIPSYIIEECIIEVRKI